MNKVRPIQICVHSAQTVNKRTDGRRPVHRAAVGMAGCADSSEYLDCSEQISWKGNAYADTICIPGM